MGSGWKVVRGSAPPEAMQLVRSGPGAAGPAVRVLRRGNTRATYLLPGVGVLKVFHRVGAGEMFGSLFATSALTREFDLTRLAVERGVPAPRPVFSAERRSFGLLRGAAILIETVPDARTLEELIAARFPPPGDERSVEGSIRPPLFNLGRVLAALHKAGGVHGDDSPDNVLVRGTEQGDVVLIDWSFALFAGAKVGDGRGDRRRLERRAAKRYHTRCAGIRAALDGFEREGIRSAAFQRLCHNDLERVTNALMQQGAPLREMLWCLEGYHRELGLGRAATRRFVETVRAEFPAALRRSVRRTLRNADRGSRRTAAVREAQATLCHRRDVAGEDVRAAFQSAGSGERFELREHAEALRAWRNACALARFRLPARRHAACRFASDGRGGLLLDRPARPFRPVAEAEPRRLADCVRLLHAFGFRFTSCGGDTISEQDPALGPFVFRQGSGYVLEDAAAVTFAPERAMEGSTEVVGSWLRDRWGAAVAGQFITECRRPLYFRF